MSTIEQKIKKKIEEKGKELKHWDINIYRGILTGFNEAFIIDSETKDRLIKESPKSAEIIRPILRGRDIKRYHKDFSDLWLIHTHNGIKGKNLPKVNVQNAYPAVYKYLQTFEAELQKRSDKGDHWSNLRNCIYFEEFANAKILYPETMRVHKNDLSNFPRFTYDDEGYYCDKTVFFIGGSDLKYLLGYLNSKIFRFLLPKYVSAWDDGGFMLQKVFLEQIPVIIPENEMKLEIEIIVDKINNVDCVNNIASLEAQINSVFYKHLSLSSEDIIVLEHFFIQFD